MTMRASLHRAGKSLARRIGVLLAAVLVVAGCGKSAQTFVVKAVAVGIPSLNPFFDERSGLGHDTTVRIREVPGGLQAGNTPGLYGGSRQPTICDVERLKEFLTDPGNDRKAKVWAQVLGITQAQIPGYLDRLTPVLLRHDTLVQNHDYKKGSATPFNSLLQAGIAVLVNDQGQPTVKCSCGNPLRPFQGDTTRISVMFQDGNRKWAGYDRSSVVAVRPAPRPLTRLVLVDVDDPGRGISRPVGTAGGHDSPFDARVRHRVPRVTGMPFAEAGRRLTDLGLAVAYAGKGAPPDEALVTGSDPAPGTELAFGQYVTLSVATATTDGPGGGTRATSTPPSSGRTTTPGKGGGASPSTPADSGKVSSPPASGGSSSPPASGGSSSPPGSGASTSGSSSPSRTTQPPASSSAAPSGTAPGATGSPTTGKPGSSSAPVTSAPGPSKTPGSSKSPGPSKSLDPSEPPDPSTTSPSKPSSSKPAPSKPPKPVTSAPETGRPSTGTPQTGKPATSKPATGAPATGAREVRPSP
ncbi:hypothetical protein SY2F82_58430 [Streptomyces sp. Y2F8-2]|uniref:PASTA domain-containing protein n=1 Tax=Streptomyces sp. Y2F8-2 TaxID=2759675 RepID=UPI00190719DE|nr:PASTA domain-containing protein [Streptomyces sp. Y2F8-2]GHK04046.1 hypothetical protein SY2F82_58430 [Streptomyces sp. Y2F8-2]